MNTYSFADYKETVIDLLQKVCTVSVETMKIIQNLSPTPKPSPNFSRNQKLLGKNFYCLIRNTEKS
ncbi:hypothetical protein [Okeania sp. SIO2B3]|uniref:hypothetical protein n=1 Tax=Okeania sp. SIO2B3 TaxID=2607784 RepID=UPI0025CDE4F1|nr:hypothetical protein [Okeania sp. SIO2B3]